MQQDPAVEDVVSDEPAGSPTVADPPQPVVPQSDDSTDEGTIKLTSAKLKERLDRSFASRLRERFGGDETELRTKLDEFEAFKAKEEEARKAQQTREEQLAEAKAQLEAQLEAERERREAAEMQHQLARDCAALNISNIQYAEHLIFDAMETHEGDDFDARAFLQQVMEDEKQKTALGVALPPTKVSAPVTTTTTDQPQPSEPGKKSMPTDVMSMTREEYQKYKRQKHGLA
jgi:hypothetical protein